jgi:hypothetical protein
MEIKINRNLEGVAEFWVLIDSDAKELAPVLLPAKTICETLLLISLLFPLRNLLWKFRILRYFAKAG